MGKKQAEKKPSTDWDRLRKFQDPRLFKWSDKDRMWVLPISTDPIMEQLHAYGVSEGEESEKMLPSLEICHPLMDAMRYKSSPYFAAYWINVYLRAVCYRFWSWLQKQESDTRKADKIFNQFEEEFYARFP